MANSTTALTSIVIDETDKLWTNRFRQPSALLQTIHRSHVYYETSRRTEQCPPNKLVIGFHYLSHQNIWSEQMQPFRHSCRTSNCLSLSYKSLSSYCSRMPLFQRHCNFRHAIDLQNKRLRAVSQVSARQSRSQYPSLSHSSNVLPSNTILKSK